MLVVARIVVAAAASTLLCVPSAFAQVPPPKPKPTAGRATAVPTATLLIKSDLAAMVSIDGEPVKKKGEQAVALEPNEIVRRSVPLGEHILEAESSDGLDKWREVLEVNKVGQRVVVVDLAAIRDARIAKEQKAKSEETREAERIKKDNSDEAARLKRENDTRAADEQRERERRLEQQRRDAADQAAVQEKDRIRRDRMSEIRSEVSRLNRSASLSDILANTARMAANTNESRAQTAEAQGKPVEAAQWRRMADNSRAEERRASDSAARDRARISDLQRELDVLGRGGGFN